jgi:hypothetical protein
MMAGSPEAAGDRVSEGSSFPHVRPGRCASSVIVPRRENSRTCGLGRGYSAEFAARYIDDVRLPPLPVVDSLTVAGEEDEPPGILLTPTCVSFEVSVLESPGIPSSKVCCW